MARSRRRLLRVLIGLMAVLVAGASVVLWYALGALQMTRIDLAPDLFVLQGLDRNSPVLLTSDGAVVVDPLPWKIIRQQLKVLKSLDTPAADAQAAAPVAASQAVKYVINTHHHKDVSHNNFHLAPGPTFVSSALAASHMEGLDGAYWRDSDHAKGLPTQRYPLDFKTNRSHVIQMGKDYVRVVYVGKGHTDGDLVVYLPSHRVVIAGDLVYSGFYPIVDHQAGGSYLDWIEALDRILALAPQRVIPGQGSVCEPAEVKAFQGYLRDLVDEVAKMKAAGKSRDQVMKEIKLPVHQARLKPLMDRLQRVEVSSLALNAGDVYDELEKGGKIPVRPSLDVEAVEGEPDDQGEEEAAGGSPAPEKTATPAPSTPKP